VRDIIHAVDNRLHTPLAEILLSEPHARFENEIYCIFQRERATYSKFRLGVCLAARNPKYLTEALQAARASLAGSNWSNPHTHVCEWMVDKFGVQVIPEISSYIHRSNNINDYAKQHMISYCASRLGKDALPVVLAGIQSPVVETRFAAVSHLIAMDAVTYAAIIKDEIERGLSEDATDTVIRHIALAARCNAADVSETLWKLAVGKSKPVRVAAARALSTAGSAVLPHALALLRDRKADSRISAVIVISSIGDPEASKALEEAVESEENDDVREEMLAALQESWKASGRKLSLDFVELRAQRVAEAGWRAPLWMSKISLPQMIYTDGRPVPWATILYILMRQQKFGDIRSPIELLSLYEQVDRRSTADFAMAVLHGFVESGADAKDKWALAIAGLLGDDRVVPVLHAQVRNWVEEGRGKLAEYAVYALALLASDRALLALDSISMRYRNKMKNVGAAAVQSFASAAESLGMTVDELGDRVVPDLGFGPGRSQVVSCGVKQVEVILGLDFKLAYVDLQRNKKIGSPPAGTPNEVKAELKELSALLRDVAKTQIRRLESLMVQQRRWPVDDWRRLFLRYPLMIPFGVRLVWGEYTANGEMMGTFRALEDSTLVSQSSELVQLDDAHTVGLVHPLELDESLWLRWKDHLDNYQVASPFPQLDRAVVIVSPEQARSVFCGDFEDCDINGMTFKGRAERLGWRRGSVCDAGGITAYVKSYPAVGVDAFVMLQGMFVGIDMYSDIQTGRLFFVAHGSVKTGSYQYDEPENDRDSRLIPFGLVPRIVYSETIGDLQNITRRNEEEDS
jgi:HEAT repeat protein